MRVEVLIPWIMIAVIGVVLYTLPNRVLKLAKEGFAAVTGKESETGQITDVHIDFWRKGLASPNFGDDSKNVRAQPEGVTGSTESKVSHADVQNVSCLSSAQGVAYKKMCDPGQPSSTNLKAQDSCLPKPIPTNSPQCPDLKDYIRKDRIPCWGCKL